MHVAQGLVQRPQRLQIPGGDGFEIAARLEHVHAGFCVGEVEVHAVWVAVDELGGGAEEEDDGGGKRPVDDDPAAFGEGAVEGDEGEDAGDVLRGDGAFVAVEACLGGGEVRVVGGAVGELRFGGCDEELPVEQDEGPEVHDLVWLVLERGSVT